MEFDLPKRKEDTWLNASRKYLADEETLALGYDPKQFLGVKEVFSRDGEKTTNYTFYPKQELDDWKECYMKRRDDDVKI